jgi:hypothetical protein
MSLKCSVCTHKDCDKINEAILAGVSNRTIAAQYRLSSTAVQRHKTKHIPKHLSQAKTAVEEVRAESLLQYTRSLLKQVEEITTDAKTKKDYRTALMGIGRIKDIVELLMKVTGELDQKTEVNVNINIEFNRIQQAIFSELEPYPEVRMRIANLLEEAKK